jgi:hypothetical protein
MAHGNGHMTLRQLDPLPSDNAVGIAVKRDRALQIDDGDADMIDTPEYGRRYRIHGQAF